MSVVQLIEVSKVIKKQPILQDINLTLERATIYGFFGRNGLGKTMLFRAISGLIKPSSGTILFNGKQLYHDISFPESIGVIIENPAFWEEYTGLENLKILASIQQKISLEEIKAAIRRVGLEPEDRRPVKKYSLGMKQRLAIAQAVMEAPDLLVLDEPTNALDEEGLQLVRTILREERKRGATILIASHNKDDIQLLADVKYEVLETPTSKDASPLPYGIRVGFLHD
ncbi:ATP-binding cassette domain-containing protein [Rubeoparvulum massiliense]|uniref:ATP-binding cassette domain-containing protein n=1 Tax=Rubeoparvulum massiliense TaxID=1631346 RepID=UPI00097597CD|nr:ATP-binding cassette domain-containing protein [Rubeoparvulum massiliense]